MVMYMIERCLPLAYGSLLLALALYKATEHWKLHGIHGSQLLFVLIKDQAFYFLLCVFSPSKNDLYLTPPRAIFCSVFNLVSQQAQTTLDQAVVLNAFGSPTLLCILGSRIFFNLKEAAAHGVNVGTNWSSYSHSAIRFEESQNGEGQIL